MSEFFRFLTFAVAFVGVLTLVVRLTRLRVHASLSYAQMMGFTAAFVGIVVATWWVVTRGDVDHRMVQSLILPSPMEVLSSFKPLHLEQGLVRSAFQSWLRVTAGFALATIVAVPLGVYMATFPSIAAFFRPLALAGAYVPIVVLIPLSMTWFGSPRPRSRQVSRPVSRNGAEAGAWFSTASITVITDRPSLRLTDYCRAPPL